MLSWKKTVNSIKTRRMLWQKQNQLLFSRILKTLRYNRSNDKCPHPFMRLTALILRWALNSNPWPNKCHIYINAINSWFVQAHTKNSTRPQCNVRKCTRSQDDVSVIRFIKLQASPKFLDVCIQLTFQSIVFNPLQSGSSKCCVFCPWTTSINLVLRQQRKCWNEKWDGEVWGKR